MDNEKCTDKPNGCMKCEHHVCLKETNGNYIGLRVAQMAIMESMSEYLEYPDILEGLNIALSKVTGRLMKEDCK